MCMLLCFLCHCKPIMNEPVCVMERTKHSYFIPLLICYYFALPNPFSCSVIKQICLNQWRADK